MLLLLLLLLPMMAPCMCACGVLLPAGFPGHTATQALSQKGTQGLCPTFVKQALLLLQLLLLASP